VTTPKPTNWTSDQARHICDLEVDLRTHTDRQIMRFQIRQNQIALEILEICHQYCLDCDKMLIITNPMEIPAAQSLAHEWSQLELWIRILRNQQRVMVPVAMAGELESDELPRDEVTKFLHRMIERGGI
jgi:hypothetical protein